MMYAWTIMLIRQAQKRQRDAFAPPAHDHRLFVFLSTGLLCLITVYLFAQNFFGEEMWIIHAGYVGGSGQYYADNAAVWYQTMGSAASVVLNWMSDAFLVRASLPVPSSNCVMKVLTDGGLQLAHNIRSIASTTSGTRTRT